ncbi:Jag N-terminal domain-containing protein, partial [Treponema pedis]
MIRLNQIKEKMTELHELDSGRFFIDTSGDTLDEALLNASVQLGVPMSSVDYEILQKGVSGFFALFPKEWKIRAYETSKPKKASPEEGEISETDNMEEGEVI